MLIEGRHQDTRRFEATFDYVIIGSGAAGATAARILAADTSASVAVVEEGPAVRTEDFGDKIWPALNKMYRDAAGFLARGRAFMPIIQGRCLGGSTVVNSAIMWRIPDDVFEIWDKLYGLADALPPQALHDCWDQIEEELAVRPVADEVLGHNRYMKRAAERLGVSGHPTRRGDTGCKGTARCGVGCPIGAKQSMLVSYLPRARQDGATIFTDARVDRIVLRGGRAEAVAGHFRGRRRVEPWHTRRRFQIRARKAVLVGASTMQTPGLLQRSGIRNEHLGEHFQAHPGSPLLGVWDEPVDAWFGATQGFDVDEHRRWRFKIETISLQPEMIFARMPGIGATWLDEMSRAGCVLTWGVQLRAWAQGSVKQMPLDLGTDVRFDPTDRDMTNLHRALRFTAELFFAAGAREVILPIHGMPERIGPDELDVFDDAPRNPQAYTWILSHLFGTTRMGIHEREGVVDTDACVFGTNNLYVLDSSLFPTNLGVNPQQPIQGITMHLTRGIADRHE